MDFALAFDLPEAGGPSAFSTFWHAQCKDKTLQGFANIDLQQIDGAFDKAKGSQIRVRNSISCQLFLDFDGCNWICLVSHGNLHMTHITHHNSHNLVSVHLCSVENKLQSILQRWSQCPGK